MSAGVGVARGASRDRARYVWIVLALSTLAFFGLCGLAANTIFGFLTSITERQTARLELRQGSQLTLQRFGTNASVVVADEAVLEEGDRTTTGPGSEAYIDLFGGDITVSTYFSTTVTIDRLRTSRFFQNLREMRLSLDSGTVVVATGAPSEYTDEDYVVATEDGDVVIPSQSRIRVYKDVRGDGTTVVVDEGTAAVFSEGNRIDIGEDRMVTAMGGGEFSAVTTDFEDLISNGNFIDPWTREADRVEHGGLDIAAWSIVREPPGTDTRLNPVVVINEEVGSSTSYLVDFKRQGPTDQYGRLGIRQEIHRPVDYFQRIELTAVIRVVQQPSIIGGPTGDLYPLRIQVNYTDAQGRPGEPWVRSFYYGQDAGTPADPPEVQRVEQNRWTTVTYTLKPNLEQPGLEPHIINSIEIYGYGPQFNSSVNSITLSGH